MYKAKLFTILLTLTVPLVLMAQPDVRWEMTYGGEGHEYARAVTELPDGGFIFASRTGSFGPNPPFNNAYWAKVSAEGEILWFNTYGREYNDEFSAAVILGDGNFIFIGTSDGFAEVPRNRPVAVIYTPEGELIRDIDLNNVTQRAPCAMVVTPDGGCLIGLNVRGERRCGLVKLNVQGDIEWQTAYGIADHNSISVSEETSSITVTGDGGYLLAGTIQQNAEGQNLPYLIYLVKVNSQGEMEWERTIRHENDWWWYAYNMIVTNDGGYAIKGNLRNLETRETNFYLMKVDSEGNPQWYRIYEDFISGGSSKIITMPDGGFLLGGTIRVGEEDPNGDVLIIRTDSDGEEIWRESYGTEMNEACSDIILCEDFGLAVLGYHEVSNSRDDIYLIRTETDHTSNNPLRWRDRPSIVYEVTAGELLQTTLRAVDYDDDEVEITLLANDLPEDFPVEVLAGEGLAIDLNSEDYQLGNYAFHAVAFDGEYTDTIAVSILLLNPALTASEEAFSLETLAGDELRVPFQLHNANDDTLHWSGTACLPGEAGNYMVGDLRANLTLDSLFDEMVTIKAVCFVEEHYYLAVSSAPDNFIVEMDRDGEVVNISIQPGESETGFTDLAWDGENLWGVDGRMIWILSLDDDVLGMFEGPFEQNQAICYDSKQRFAWVSGISTDIVGVDVDGEEVARLNRQGLDIYGMAYWRGDPDGMSLYFLTNPGDYQQLLYRQNPDENDPQLVFELDQPGRAAPGGVFISVDFDGGETAVLMTAAAGQFRTTANVWHIFSNTSWMTLTPEAGAIDPDCDLDISLTLSALPTKEEPYEGILKFQHDGQGSGFEIPLSLSVLPNGISPDHHSSLPDRIAISVSPNPFNAMASITILLPEAGRWTLKVYDLNGRLVDARTLATHQAGEQRLNLDASDWRSGVYFLTMKYGASRITRKVVLLR